MVEQKKKIHREMMHRFKGRKQVLSTYVPYVTDIEKMGLYRQPVPAYLPDSRAGQTYSELWREIEEKLPGCLC